MYTFAGVRTKRKAAKKKFNHLFIHTREMQGIVGLASELVAFWRLLFEFVSVIVMNWLAGFPSQRATKTSNVRVTVFCVSTAAHARSQIRVHAVGVCAVRTLAGMSGFVIVLDMRGACEQKKRWALKREVKKCSLVVHSTTFECPRDELLAASLKKCSFLAQLPVGSSALFFNWFPHCV